MVGTRHAVSDNNSKSGLGMPSPYIPEREQLRRKLGNCATQQNNFLQGVQGYGERNYGDLTMCVCRDMRRGRVGG